MSIFSNYQARYEDTEQEEYSLKEYLEICKADSSAYATAAERLLIAIGEPESIDTSKDIRLSRIFSNKIIKRYSEFGDFYGMEECIEQIVSFFKHAAQGLEEKKQILYLLGPVGGGKSSLAEKLKELMERIPFYSVKGSPVHESPLGLFNPSEDAQILREEYGIPVAQFNAQMYRRFGSKVTVVEMHDRIISRDDEDVSATVQEILEDDGVRFRLGADCIETRVAGAGVAVRVTCENGPEEEIGSHLLLAVGRVPNTHDLGLDKAGIETNQFGFINVDEQLRTAVPGVWAIGDVNGRGAFTHTSYNDFEIVAANLFDDDPRQVSDRILCYGLFIDPPLGRIGMTENEVRASGRRALIGKRMMTRVGRAREFGETRGFIKIIVDADTEEILGAAILGLTGDEAIHSLLGAMYAKQRYSVVSRAVHIHPTVSELIPTVG